MAPSYYEDENFFEEETYNEDQTERAAAVKESAQEAPTTPKDPNVFPFMALPLEVRERIYIECLSNLESPDSAGKYEMLSGSRMKWFNEDGTWKAIIRKDCIKAPAIICVNKQVYKEALPFLYTMNKFCITIWGSLFVCQPWYNPESINLRRNKVPRLIDSPLRSFTYPPGFSNVRFLEFALVADNEFLEHREQQLFDAMQATPNLEELTIRVRSCKNSQKPMDLFDLERWLYKFVELVREKKLDKLARLNLEMVFFENSSHQWWRIDDLVKKLKEVLIMNRYETRVMEDKGKGKCLTLSIAKRRPLKKMTIMPGSGPKTKRATVGDRIKAFQRRDASSGHRIPSWYVLADTAAK